MDRKHSIVAQAIERTWCQILLITIYVLSGLLFYVATSVALDIIEAVFGVRIGWSGWISFAALSLILILAIFIMNLRAAEREHSGLDKWYYSAFEKPIAQRVDVQYSDGSVERNKSPDSLDWSRRTDRMIIRWAKKS